MTDKEKRLLFDRLLKEIHNLRKEKDISKIKQRICRILKSEVPYYDWVGFYMSDGNNNLILTEFEGEPTIHTRIRFGEGICGQAAELKRTFLVKDVSKEKNYLSCSIKVKSEIVVPIMIGERFIGELDIDSHTLNAFDENDREFLEKICAFLALIMQESPLDQNLNPNI